MGLFSDNSTKSKQIELQNIIFGTNEKKLMVSNEFLNEMSKAYVTKRMKNINKMQSVFVTTKSPKRFFMSYESVIADLDELINIERLYTFKKPVPSEFKKSIESKKEHYIESMIKRAWKDVNQKSGVAAGEKKDPQKFGPMLDEMLEYRSEYSKVMLDLIDQFYESVYEKSFRAQPEQPESEQPAEELSEKNSEISDNIEDIPEELALESDDGFVEEEFMQLTE